MPCYKLKLQPALPFQPDGAVEKQDPVTAAQTALVLASQTHHTD